MLGVVAKLTLFPEQPVLLATFLLLRVLLHELPDLLVLTLLAQGWVLGAELPVWHPS